MGLFSTGGQPTRYKIVCDNCGKVIAQNQSTEEAMSYVKSDLTVGILDLEIGVNVLKYFCCDDCLEKYKEK